MVRFNDSVQVRYMWCWNFAYRSARKGLWEQYARDRCRFHRKIAQLAKIIEPVLLNKIKICTMLRYGQLK